MGVLLRERVATYAGSDQGVPRKHWTNTQHTLRYAVYLQNVHTDSLFPGGFYDFTSDLSSKDTAYTNLGLEAHTDTTYFSDPAGLQAFHMLSHEDGSGGESLLVDGFAAAGRLYRNDMSAYETLSTTGVSYHASGNDGVSIQPYATFPVLQHHPRGGQLMQVRWNNADRAGLARTHKNLDEWYRAAG